VLGTGTYAASGVYGSGTTTGMWLPDLTYPASSPWTTAVGGHVLTAAPAIAIACNRRRIVVSSHRLYRASEGQFHSG